MTRITFGCMILLSLFSCKKTQDSSSGQVKQLSDQTFNAADHIFITVNQDFYFRALDKKFKNRLSELSPSGQVSAAKQPMSGNWYPEKKGGTDVIVSGNASPLKKYDDAFHGGKSTSVKWEGEKHNSTASWAGHCNGTSAAAQRHPQIPRKNVVRNGQTFTPLDIKALMSEVYMNADFLFLGGYRCEQSDGGVTDPTNRENPTFMDACSDVNPGTMHLAVANWIHEADQVIIMDYHQTDQVWNFPFYKYEVTRMNDGISVQQARQYVTGGQGNYIFNPDAKRFAYVEMKLYYANVLNDVEKTDELVPGVVDLKYVLEMNQRGEIIGGEWAGTESQRTHPDFIWIALPPLEPNGTRYMGNPHVDTDEVIGMWAESAGVDLDSLPSQLERTDMREFWGKFPDFTVTVNGNDRGVVLGGDEAHLLVQSSEVLADAKLEVYLNGETVGGFENSMDYQIEVSLKTHAGINRVRLVWMLNNEYVQERTLLIHQVL